MGGGDRQKRRGGEGGNSLLHGIIDRGHKCDHIICRVYHHVFRERSARPETLVSPVDVFHLPKEAESQEGIRTTCPPGEVVRKHTCFMNYRMRMCQVACVPDAMT